MANKQRYTAGEVIEAVQRARGLLFVAAQRLGCTRQTVENYVKRYATVAQAVEEERQKTIDIAEGKLFEKLQTGESWAIQFILKTLGKDRGYTERTEITGAEGGAMVIKYTGNVDPRDI
jgi:hypothetical protein